MCQGQRQHDFRGARYPTVSLPATARAEVDTELAAMRARLAESLAQLERMRARAIELRRRLEESYAERDRLNHLLSALMQIRDRVSRKRSRTSGPD